PTRVGPLATCSAVMHGSLAAPSWLRCVRTVATLAAGEGAPGAVVPISGRRRPGRGVARSHGRRIAGLARFRRAVAPRAAPSARATAAGGLPRGRHERTRSGHEPAP